MTWPRDMRRHLAASRREGVPFEIAWEMAMDDHPALPHAEHGWTCELIAWARERFRRAYYGHPLRGNASILTEERPMTRNTCRRPVVEPDHARCRSGDKCPRTREAGSYFCALHGAEIARIREAFEASESREWDFCEPLSAAR